MRRRVSHRVERGVLWEVHLGDALTILPELGDVNHCLTDPPYSRRVHEGARTSGRKELPDAAEFSCRHNRRIEIGFDHLRPPVRRAIARWCAERVRRWSVVFSDVESAWLWRISLEAAGVNYRRTGMWARQGGAPQFNGMEPASAFEAIIISHKKGARRWNGGGKAARWNGLVVQNRLGSRGMRVHETQKPTELMMELVTDFTDEGETICDPFTGSATTGVAVIRLGRRFVGIEQDAKHFETAVERLRAEETNSDIAAARAGQTPLFR